MERVARASTVPFRDGAWTLSPWRTVRSLRAGDVLIAIGVNDCAPRPEGGGEPHLRLRDAKRQVWPEMRPGDPPLLRMSASPFGNHHAVFARDAAGRARAAGILRDTGWLGTIG